MAGKLKLGLVGYGLNQLVHTLEFRFVPRLRGRTEVVAIFDPDPAVQAKLRKKKAKKGVHVASSFEDLLAVPDLEGLIVSSPPQYHADQVVAALEAGLHVYSEVPMALTREDVARVVTAAEASPAKYQLGENYCFLREVMYAGYLITSGRLGPAVYAESEYLHDVSYRWRPGKHGDVSAPRVEAWYSLFDPLAYAHSIGPAQVALGGIEHPAPFVEVTSYANDVGGHEGNPVCRPAKAFHVALFRTATDAVAKCANAYVFAREPMRLQVQVTGRFGTYECYQIGKKGRLFEADDHVVKKRIPHRRAGSSKKVGRRELKKAARWAIGGHHGSNTRIKGDWLRAIETDGTPLLHARVAANMCLPGIAASESAREGRRVAITPYELE